MKLGRICQPWRQELVSNSGCCDVRDPGAGRCHGKCPRRSPELEAPGRRAVQFATYMGDVGPSESVGRNSGRFRRFQGEGGGHQAVREIGTWLHAALLLETDRARRSYPQAGQSAYGTGGSVRAQATKGEEASGLKRRKVRKRPRLKRRKVRTGLQCVYYFGPATVPAEDAATVRSTLRFAPGRLRPWPPPCLREKKMTATLRTTSPAT